MSILLSEFWDEEDDNMVEKSKLGRFEIFDFLHW